jgi:hypothetical protein
MTRDEITELHFIAPIANVPPIMKHGILCHKRAGQIEHHSVAMAEIQERRTNKRIPGAGTLHDYANLYFDAHNPMLSRLRAQNEDICVLQVDAKVLDSAGVIIADRNAASDWVRFSPVVDGLKGIDRDRVFARYWIHSQDVYDEMSHKSEKCAEVLVPDCVRPGFLLGAYVANATALQKFQQLNIGLPVSIRNDIFF